MAESLAASVSRERQGARDLHFLIRASALTNL